MRFKIALRNLIFSQLIICVFLVFTYFTWFPHSFSKLGGFNETALMLIFVDIVLGPLLVFIVYKKDKKHLTFDINILLGIQLAAFVYGAYAMYLKHPAYNVFINDRFKLVNVSYSAPAKVRFENLKTSFFSSPKMAYTELPSDEQELTRIMIGVDLFGEPDIDRRAELYKPPSHAFDKILSKQLDPAFLFSTNESKIKLRKFMKKHGGVITNFAFFPISGNNQKEVVFVIDNKSAEAIGIIDMKPKLQIAKISKSALD